MTEGAKKILGTSTQALEEARVDSLSQTFACDYYACYESILALKRIKKEDGTEEGFFDILMQSRPKGYIVVIGIKGNVDTTEVGIFLVRVGVDKIRIEISSLASTAKQRVAEEVFEKLSQQFNTINDKE